MEVPNSLAYYKTATMFTVQAPGLIIINSTSANLNPSGGYAINLFTLATLSTNQSACHYKSVPPLSKTRSGMPQESTLARKW